MVRTASSSDYTVVDSTQSSKGSMYFAIVCVSLAIAIVVVALVCFAMRARARPSEYEYERIGGEEGNISVGMKSKMKL